jgi:membrane-bound lytic murein transglycosylase D
MNERRASRRGRLALFSEAWVLFLLLIAVAACSGSSAPPQTAPVLPEPESAPVIAMLREEAGRHFDAGETDYRAGDYAAADQHFQLALEVYLQANVGPAERNALQQEFNDLFNRIHALGLSELVSTTSADAVSLYDEPLPPPSAEHLDALRARLAVEPLELPSFSIPVPTPMENERVEWALAYLTGERKEVVEEALSRATRFMPMIEAIFDEVGVPRELAWVPLIESLYKTGAYSRAAAVGLWQFMSGTARMYGMKIDYNVDERRDPVKATRTAALYMKELYEKYEDWALVLAAYNAGWGRINRALDRAGVDNFWDLAETRHIPRETRDHVPKIYASILIGTDPAYYGLEVVPLAPYVYDESLMDANTDLRLVADLVGVSFEEIRELNPHIMAWVPKGYPVRTPAGSKPAFEAALASIPAAERIEFLTHVVSRGETLSHIATTYATRQAAIIEVNNLRNANRLSIGQRLIIPVGPESRPYRSRPMAGFDTGERTTYTVQRGDSLFLIAQHFRTEAPNLMRWNNLASDRIYPGDTLIVYYGVRDGMATPAAVAGTANTPLTADAQDGDGDNGSGAAGPERNLYTVRAGDSLYVIASRFSVSVDDLKRWNNRRSNTIHPGDKLVVFAAAALFSGQPGGTANTTVRRYTVRRGDSPYVIAERHGVSLDALLAANGLNRRSSIYPGDELLIPGGDAERTDLSYTVRRGDTLGAIADAHGIPLGTLLAANGLSSRSIIHPGKSLTIPRR